MAAEAPPGLPVRLLFQDEGRFGRISDLRRCWAPLPVRPVVSHQVVREYLYAYLAVCPFDGRCASLVLPWSDTPCMNLFLAHTAQIFPHEFCIMILDGAGWHGAADLELPPHLRLLTLPPYSPELNPVEHLWEHLRENHFGNDVLPTLESVADRLCLGIQDLIAHPEIVQRMTCFDWIRPLCMTSN